MIRRPPRSTPRPRISAPLRGPRGSSPPSSWPHHDREHHPRCHQLRYPAHHDAGVVPVQRLLIAGAALSLVLGGFIGHAASTLTPDSVLLNGAPCTITNNGLSSAGTCSGAFVQTVATPAPTPTLTSTPAPTPTPAPAPTPTPAPPLGGITPLYAAPSFWHLPIGPAPVLDPNSAAMVQAALAGSAGSANFANTAAWGRAMVFSHNSDPVYTVACTMYDCGTVISFHIPLGATPETGSDHHLVVINLDTNQELDMWLASFSGGARSARKRHVTPPPGRGGAALRIHPHRH